MNIKPQHGYHLRVSRPEDATQLSVLALQVWLHTYAWNGISGIIADYVLAELTPAKFATILEDPRQHVFVAQRDENLLGFAVINSAAPCPYGDTKAIELATLYVQEHFIGTGLGTALIQAAQHWAYDQHQCPLWLKVNAQNHRAIGFYESHSYSKTGSIDFVLGGQRHENYVMLGSPVFVDDTQRK